jgi:hypothetical protein
MSATRQVADGSRIFVKKSSRFRAAHTIMFLLSPSVTQSEKERCAAFAHVSDRVRWLVSNIPLPIATLSARDLTLSTRSHQSKIGDAHQMKINRCRYRIRPSRRLLKSFRK